jgi:surfeit locus 1 family protein
MLVTLAVLGLALFVGFSALGVWQMQRRAWKLDLITRVTERIYAAPVAAPTAAQWPRLDVPSLEYQAVRLHGHWLANKTVLTQASTVLGAGYWVLTPLQQADGTQVLVNRGFVPSAHRTQLQAPKASDQSPVTVVGLLRKSEPGGGFLRSNDPAQQRWHSRDVAAIALALQLGQAAPFFVDAGIPSQQQDANAAELQAASAGPWPRPGLTVVHFANNHLVYAFTWFGLALMVAGAGELVARYERRQRRAAHPIAHDRQD